MSNKNEASKDESRDLESSDEEHPINPEVRILSRIFGVHRASVANMPGTSGTAPRSQSQSQTQTQSTQAPRRTPRQERDRLFWTLLGNSSRLPNNKYISNSARAPRPTMFADLLEPERRRARNAAMLSRYTTPPAYKPSTSFASLDSSLRNMLRKRTQDRLKGSSSANGGSSSSGRQVIVVHARGDRGDRAERGLDAADGNRTGTHEGDGRARHEPVVDVDGSVETSEPLIAIRSASEFFAELNRTGEEPINMSTGAMSLEEEILEVEPEPRADAEEAATTQDPANVSAETSQQPRGTKRKRDREREGDTHESVSTLNQTILRLLECPVCMEWMEPPIAQCRRGHLVCGACRKRLETCPVCRTAFSSVRNRAMEDVAGILRYPCRHGCGRSVRAARRQKHEASCLARRHACPLPACRAAPMPRCKLAVHCQAKHPSCYRAGAAHRVALGAGEQHVQWLVSALDATFHVRVHVDARAWGVLVHAAHVGPVDQAPRFTYEVTVYGRSPTHQLTYRRSTHSDLENFALNTSRQDCFHLTRDQVINYMRYTTEPSESDKVLELSITLAQAEIDEEVVADSG